MKVTAFIKKDLLIMFSYKFRLILQLGNLVFSLFMFYFIGKTFSGALSPFISQYGGSYFSYALVGIAVSSFVTVGLDALADEVRSAQVEGTLEALLTTPTSIYTILLGNSVWSFIEAFFSTALLIIFGIIFAGLDISPAGILPGLLVLGITAIAFLVVGMLSASFIMIFKQGNPIGLLFGSSSYFLGGVVFPVEVLPKPFQFVANFLPTTHAVKALRELLLADMAFSSIQPMLIKLIIFIVILSPVSIIFFRYAVNRAKRDGSLVQY